MDHRPERKYAMGAVNTKLAKKEEKKTFEITEENLKAYKEDERKQKTVEYLSHKQLSTPSSESEPDHSDSEDE